VSRDGQTVLFSNWVVYAPSLLLLFTVKHIVLLGAWKDKQELPKVKLESALKCPRDPPPGCTKPPDLTSCTSHWTTTNREKSDQETLTHIHSSYHSCPLTHSASLVLLKSPFKITRKTQFRPKSMVSCLCSVLITEWDQLGIQGWGSSPRAAGSGLGWHLWTEINLICMSSCFIASFWVWCQKESTVHGWCRCAERR
jgi:hypothetical protein